MKRYRRTFTFCETEDQAKRFCEAENKRRYIRSHHPAHYAKWSSSDGKEQKFIVWYVTK